jgi:hypothetical protein
MDKENESATGVNPAPFCEGVEYYPISGWVFKRESTQEWVLEINGVINDTSFVCRHSQPLTINPEDVAGLPTLYETNKPARVPLSEERIKDLPFKLEGGGWPRMSRALREFAREVERAHEIVEPDPSLETTAQKSDGEMTIDQMLPLPSWSELSDRVDNGETLSALEQFLYQYDNADAAGSKKFYKDIAAVLKEVADARTAELQARVKELEADAARYRWLRERIVDVLPMVRVQIMRRGQYVLIDHELDDTIDGARSKYDLRCIGV